MRWLILLTASVFFLSVHIHQRLRFPFPPFNELIWDTAREFEKGNPLERPLGSEGGFRDFGGLFMGMRRMTADIAWLSVLQYYGSREEGSENQAVGHHFGGGRYPALKKMVLRVVRLDPQFHFAYLYGAGSLAFNLERYDQAAELLEDGVKRNPTFWKFRLYIAAILWKKQGNYEKLIPLLEEAVAYPDCPNLVKSCLANIYKSRNNFARALEIWMDVYESPNVDETYRRQSSEQIEVLKQKLGLN